MKKTDIKVDSKHPKAIKEAISKYVFKFFTSSNRKLLDRNL